VRLARDGALQADILSPRMSAYHQGRPVPAAVERQVSDRSNPLDGCHVPRAVKHGQEPCCAPVRYALACPSKRMRQEVSPLEDGGSNVQVGIEKIDYWISDSPALKIDTNRREFEKY